jgi:hypothetical protein
MAKHFKAVDLLHKLLGSSPLTLDTHNKNNFLNMSNNKFDMNIQGKGTYKNSSNMSMDEFSAHPSRTLSPYSTGGSIFQLKNTDLTRFSFPKYTPLELSLFNQNNLHKKSGKFQDSNVMRNEIRIRNKTQWLERVILSCYEMMSSRGMYIYVYIYIYICIYIYMYIYVYIQMLMYLNICTHI